MICIGGSNGAGLAGVKLASGCQSPTKLPAFLMLTTAPISSRLAGLKPQPSSSARPVRPMRWVWVWVSAAASASASGVSQR